ncbi:MAG: hypothetical protein PVS2B2_16340 [Candidatus Acidiferrum sp.]
MIGPWKFLDRIIVETESDGSKYQQTPEGTHKLIVEGEEGQNKGTCYQDCPRKQCQADAGD